MHFGTVAMLNLKKRPIRSLLTTLGIAVAVGSFVSIVGLTRGFERAWINTLLARGTHLIAFQKGAVDLLTTSIDARAGEQIRRIDGVRDVAGELADLMVLEAQYSTVAVGWESGGYLWETLKLVSGRLPAPGEDRVVLLGESAAEALKKKAGDSLMVRERPFKILGIFRVGGVMGNNSTVLPLPVMQEMMQRQGKVSCFNIRVVRPDDPERAASVRSRLRAAFPNLSVVETSSLAENDMILRLFHAVAWSVSLISIFIALVVVLNTLLMSVIERTHEIGILSAIGWPTRRIVGMIVLEGLVLSLVGGVAGLAIGTGGLHWVVSLPRMRGLIEPEVTLRLLIEVLGAATGLGGLGSLYPAWRAARLNIVDALRYE
jgi:putative ABC transport system permease protein